MYAAVHTSSKMADIKSYLCFGCCALFLGIVIMSIALIATSLRKLDSDEGKPVIFISILSLIGGLVR